MQRALPIAILLLALFATCVTAQVDAERWAQAERQIRRLTPQQYRGLPHPISGYLRRHGYTIPQSYDTEGQHNVISGLYDNDAVRDWAVLASHDGFSQILVFWGGSAARVTMLNRRADANFLQGLGGDDIGYSRRISTVDRKYILYHYAAYGGPKPPPIRHNAIDDGFSGKASGVLYFDGRRWHSLQGAD